MTALALAVRRRLRATPPLPRRAVAASAVCAGHVLVLLALLADRQAAPRDKAAAPRLLQIRLLPAPRPQAAAAPAAVAATAPTSPTAGIAPRPVAVVRAPAVPAAVVSDDAPATTPPAPAASAGDAGAPAPGASGVAATVPGQGGAGLSLKPSREVLLGSLGSNAAVNDPRSNTPKPTFEERIAMALNPELCVKVERLPDGTTRRSMGKWRSVQSTAQSSGVTSGGGSGAGVAPPGGGGLTFGGGGGGIRLCT